MGGAKNFAQSKFGKAGIGAQIGSALGGGNPFSIAMGAYGGYNQGGGGGGGGRMPTSFEQMLMQGGLNINPAVFQGRTEIGGALQKLEAGYTADYANSIAQNKFLKEFGPQQLETAAGLAKKDFELISQLPQYKPFLDLQNQAVTAAGEQFQGLGKVRDLLNLDQYANGGLSGDLQKRIQSGIADTSALFGVQDQPGFAAQAGFKFGAEREMLSNQLLTSGINTLNSYESGVFGRAGNVLNSYRMPGSLLGSVGMQQGVGRQALGDYTSGFAADKARRDQIDTGYGQLAGAGIGLAMAPFTGGASMGFSGLGMGGGGGGGAPGYFNPNSWGSYGSMQSPYWGMSPNTG